MEEKEKQELVGIITKEVSSQLQHANNGVFKKIIIGIMIVAITSGAAAFLGVMTGQKVDRQRIKNNTEDISRVEEDVNKIESNQWELRKDIWRLSVKSTRGGITNDKEVD